MSSPANRANNTETRQLSTALSDDGTKSDRERLAAIWQLRRRLHDEEDAIAIAMRLRGSTWQEIATEFHMTRQAAHQRFARTPQILGDTSRLDLELD